MTKPDPGFVSDAWDAAARTLADALARELPVYRYLPAALLPRSWLLGIARRQLEALLALPPPTRAALLGEPR